MLIRIIKPFVSIGLNIDTDVYVSFFKTYYPKCTIEVSDTSVKINKIEDIHIYISNTKYELTTMAKTRIFMINHELFFQKMDDLKVLRNIDYILCRTKIGIEWAKKIKLKYNLKYELIYTKFTSLFKTIDVDKVQNLIFHSAGEHHWKQTDVIIKTWKKYNDLPAIIVTCTGQCFNNIKGILGDETPKNMYIYNELFDISEFILMKNKIGIHLCPSIVEGYGHYINEARKVKSLVITTNFPPMNELIDNKSGILIDCASFGNKKNGTTLCFINEDELYLTIKKIMEMPYKKRNEFIENAYENFLGDTNFFNESMKEFFDKLIRF